VTPRSWCVSVLYTFAAKNADSLGVPLNAPGAGRHFSADRQWVTGCMDGYSQTHPRSPSPTAPQAVAFTCDTGYYGWDPQQGLAYQVFEPENACGMTGDAEVALAMPSDGYAKTYRELVETTDWARYGRGRDPRCANCMAHCGYEPTAGLATMGSLKQSLRALSGA
jgi:Domain of unknown function (DUF3463)